MHAKNTVPPLPSELLACIVAQLEAEHHLLQGDNHLLGDLPSWSQSKPAALSPKMAQRWWRGNRSHAIKASPTLCLNAMLTCARLNRAFQAICMDAALWQRLCISRFSPSLPPVRDFRSFYLKHHRMSTGVPLPHKKSWSKGLHLLVEVCTPNGVANMSLPLSEAEPVDGSDGGMGISWQQLEDGGFMNVLMEAGGFDKCAFGACYLWRESDEKMCLLSLPLDQAMKLRADHKPEAPGAHPWPMCNYHLPGVGNEYLSFELFHARNYVALSAECLDARTSDAARSWFLMTNEGEYSTEAQIKSHLELEWYSGYNDCVEVRLAFLVLAASDNDAMEHILCKTMVDDDVDWSDISVDQEGMERLLRVLDWQ